MLLQPVMIKLSKILKEKKKFTAVYGHMNGFFGKEKRFDVNLMWQTTNLAQARKDSEECIFKMRLFSTVN